MVVEKNERKKNDILSSSVVIFVEADFSGGGWR
jgi:hypothetical protein